MKQGLIAGVHPFEHVESQPNGKRKTCRVVLLHVGVVGTVALYIVLGACVFAWIEGGAKKVVPHTTNATAVEVTERTTLNTNESVTDAEQWTLGTGILFTWSLVTTIGYGHVSPKTEEGKLFCMIYSTLGIPLTLLMLADIGQFITAFANKCSVIFHKKNRVGRHNPAPHNVTRIVVGVFLILWVLSGVVVYAYTTNNNFMTSLYFIFISLSTVGLGDYIPPTMNQWLVLHLTYMTIGLAVMSLALEQLASALQRLHWFGRVMPVSEMMVWVGGRKVPFTSLAHNLLRKAGLPTGRIEALMANLQDFVQNPGEHPEDAIDAAYPDLHWIDEKLMLYYNDYTPTIERREPTVL